MLCRRLVGLRRANVRCVSAAAPKDDVTSLKALVEEQKAHIQELSEMLAKAKAQKPRFIDDEDANDVMKQRLQQLMAIIGACSFLMLFYLSRQNKALVNGLDTMASNVKTKMETLKNEVKELENCWAVEMQKKEEQLQQMHQQSTEQTRSIDRLTTAIRSFDKSA
eukprot:TRINITY_DN10648_c0_g1_i1.p1 TRINITY_DN10648_c0_g1~~TRINITY_DN10648_c0_g1_i1.p1  ORF type:complete len:179 (+),score=81.52 TRINITY_DN10648_c0_g1_i1:43-537(+)